MARSNAPLHLELDPDQVAGLLERVRVRVSEEDYRLLQAIVSTLLYVAELLAKKKASIRRLTKLLFGVRTEKASALLPSSPTQAKDAACTATAEPTAGKRRGHGRNGAEDYRGATRIVVAHPSLKPGDACPDGCCGRLYRLKRSVELVRFRGKAALDAVVYGLEQLRCALCGKVFTAPAPPEAGDDKYDATAVAMIAVLRYGAGLPLHRIERLQACLDLPLSSSTQWDLLNQAAGPLRPVLGELIGYGAQGELFHNDDTSMKILAFLGKRAETARNACAGEQAPKKRAVFTSGLVLLREGRKVVLFFTGPKHAGENLAEVLSRRASELPAPLHMCDALSRNVPKLPHPLEMILANCLTHGRRQFVDVLDHFPDECRYVIETLAVVYRNDEVAREPSMSPAERLLFHQAQSKPLMDGLHAWLLDSREQKKVEPNSGLGQAIAYMLNHWHKLTVFLKVAGAPLDNNVCERALKKAILHRKNSLFYKTQHGADVGDLYMSLIATCEMNGVNPLTYLTELMRHPAELQVSPAEWMPWNYTEALGRQGEPRAGPVPPDVASSSLPATAPRRRPSCAGALRPATLAPGGPTPSHPLAPTPPAC